MRGVRAVAMSREEPLKKKGKKEGSSRECKGERVKKQFQESEKRDILLII